MNKHLVDFIDDELKNNDYYLSIREFAQGKDWNRDILSDVVNEYDDHIGAFGPYRFLDAIEDYLTKLEDDNNPVLKTATGLYEIIDLAWDEDFFENY